jgi:hypothetical protein
MKSRQRTGDVIAANLYFGEFMGLISFKDNLLIKSDPYRWVEIFRFKSSFSGIGSGFGKGDFGPEFGKEWFKGWA